MSIDIAKAAGAVEGAGGASAGAAVDGAVSGGSAVADQSANAGAGATAGTSIEWAPNFKFKAGGEEKEFDDFLRGSIKDADSEAKIRDLYTKAHGLDPLKARLTSEADGWKKKFDETAPVAEKYQSLTESLNGLSHFVQNNDFDSFFEALKIPLPRVAAWMQKKIQEHDMLPEQKAEVARTREIQNELYLLKKQNQDLMTRFDDSSMEQSTRQLESTLERPEIKSMAENFDAKVGTPGAFRSEVIKRGVLLYHMHGRDFAPEEVLKDLLGTYGNVLAPAPQAQGSGQMQQGGSAKAPIIPNIASKGGSPVKSAPKSIQDLKNLAASL